MLSDKPFSQACENNKGPIFNVLKPVLQGTTQVLEIGSGTGQHAAYFAPQLSHLNWQTSDVLDNHSGIIAWLEEVNSTNIQPPICFKVGEDEWPVGQFDAIYSANTTHIMQPHEAQLMMKLISEHLPANGVFCQYGPFKIDGQCTSLSNQLFDQQIINKGYGGIRDINELQSWATALELVERIEMPANNFLLIWCKL